MLKCLPDKLNPIWKANQISLEILIAKSGGKCDRCMLEGGKEGGNGT